MKNDNWILLLAGLLILCTLVTGIREGLITKDMIVLALAVIGGFIVVFWVSILVWFGRSYYILSREDKKKAKGE